MVQINFAQKTVNVKIVYYGPGMSGKTTNLEVIHQRAPEANRGDLTSISTDGDRTLFFDFMPLDLGTVAGMRTQFQIYTVPGQVYYNSTRKLVLQGVDGVIFVADSSASMLEQNLQSLRNLEENLNEYGKSLATMPHVIQYNKRDLPDAMTVDELEAHMNAYGASTFEAVAKSGQGVFPTLKSLASCVLKAILEEAGESHQSTPPSAPAPARRVVEQPAAPMPSPEVSGSDADSSLYEELDARPNAMASGIHSGAQAQAGAAPSATAMRHAQRKPLLTPDEAQPAQRRGTTRQPSMRGTAVRRPVEHAVKTGSKGWVTPVAVGAAALLGAVGAWAVLNFLG